MFNGISEAAKFLKLIFYFPFIILFFRIFHSQLISLKKMCLYEKNDFVF